MQIQLDTSGMPNRLRLVLEAPPPSIEIAFGTCAFPAKTRSAGGMTIDRIKEVVAVANGMRAQELDSGRRGDPIERVRQVAMFIATEVTNYSLPQIAREFGKRDHTAVMCARDKVNHRMKSDEGFRSRIRTLIAECQVESSASPV